MTNAKNDEIKEVLTVLQKHIEFIMYFHNRSMSGAEAVIIFSYKKRCNVSK